ncbi:(2Fe-2S) ferredoxin domain-containing protein [Paenibacillus methanolicus]|uniref:(2Fe-2S) ferredoxin n=1 Tax=Paenibacillus methanolicus TaxID=582686 RepID=A0A5S5CF84_9BACL|nr:(2Fe-2S) ferredoxin domain-containing protein [Paenibacillus methanolicus]TYP76663.1 (2Fe-2S) ferredoxin [Paenibacillus methanolicus]
MVTWNLNQTKHHVLICNGGSCMRQQGEEVTLAIRSEIARHAAEDGIHTTRTRCNGRCDDACVVIVYPEGIWYRDMTPETGRRLVREHLLQSKPLQDRVAYSYLQDRFVPSGMGTTGVLRKDKNNK